MNPREHFTNCVLPKLLIQTKWIKDNFELDKERDKTKRWRCLSCDQLCGYAIHRITLLNGTKCWEMNVDNIQSSDDV